mmetsp:Transcript_21651/g.55073  ORF Transcript_21651/g.55073 Transcript_21651/m.55073 type:complete len:200 (+) Transcript_21651:421-1020(+)
MSNCSPSCSPSGIWHICSPIGVMTRTCIPPREFGGTVTRSFVIGGAAELRSCGCSSPPELCCIGPPEWCGIKPRCCGLRASRSVCCACSSIEYCSVVLRSPLITISKLTAVRCNPSSCTAPSSLRPTLVALRVAVALVTAFLARSTASSLPSSASFARCFATTSAACSGFSKVPSRRPPSLASHGRSRVSGFVSSYTLA